MADNLNDCRLFYLRKLFDLNLVRKGFPMPWKSEMKKKESNCISEEHITKSERETCSSGKQFIVKL